MLIKTQKIEKATVVNTDYIYGFRVDDEEDDDQWTLIAVNGDCTCISELGKYDSEADAEYALDMLLLAYEKGRRVYAMPEE